MPSQIQEQPVRWNIKVSKETDLSLRTFLGARGMKKGDLSKFIEDAVPLAGFPSHRLGHQGRQRHHRTRRGATHR